jgi:hypothetical protein
MSGPPSSYRTRRVRFRATTTRRYPTVMQFMSRRPDRLEPEIDHFVMAITAAEAMVRHSAPVRWD